MIVMLSMLVVKVMMIKEMTMGLDMMEDHMIIIIGMITVKVEVIMTTEMTMGEVVVMAKGMMIIEMISC